MSLDENKEKILEEWLAVRNAILRASDGQLRVTYNYGPSTEGGESAAAVDKSKILGVFIELALLFSEPTQQDFTEEEKDAVIRSLQQVEKVG